MPRSLRLALAVAFLAGCGSSTTAPSGGAFFFRFSANGTTVEYTNQPSLLAAFGHAGAQYNALVTGFDATSNADVQMFDGAAITQRAYTGYDIAGGAVVGALIGYQDPSGVVYRSGIGATDAVIVVTELTATTMKGTFTAHLTSSGHPDIIVTNGEFFVQRAN